MPDIAARLMRLAGRWLHIARWCLHGLAIAIWAAPSSGATDVPVSSALRMGHSIDATASNCSAVLVGPRLAITAGHCVGPKAVKGSWGRRSPSVFTGWADGQAEDQIRLTGWRRPLPSIDLDRPWYEQDIAVVRLARPLLGAEPLQTAPAPLQNQNVVMIAYPGNLDTGALVRACAVTQVQRTHFVIDCPSSSGVSGAPVLSETAEGWQVVGIIVAQLGQGANGSSLAVPIDPSLLE